MEDDLANHGPTPLVRDSIESSRMGAYTVIGALSTIVPLPWVPDHILKRVRSTLIYDIASRHGLSIQEEARDILAEPWNSDIERSLIGYALRFALRRISSRIGPFGFLSPARAAASTFMVGHLFNRYLELGRTDRALRIDANEAIKVRAAMDRTLRLFVTMDVSSPFVNISAPPENLRSGTTQVVDGVILSLASLPAWAVTRLEAAFDDALGSANHE